MHHEYQNKGIGKILLDKLENEVIQSGASVIFVTSSLTASSFFEKYGFQKYKIQTVVRKGVTLRNVKMKKQLML